MSRSTPAASNWRTCSRAPSGVPVIQRSEAFVEPLLLVGARADHADERRQPLAHLGLVAADQHAGHRRVGERRRVASDGLARRVRGGEHLTGMVAGPMSSG